MIRLRITEHPQYWNYDYNYENSMIRAEAEDMGIPENKYVVVWRRMYRPTGYIYGYVIYARTYEGSFFTDHVENAVEAEVVENQYISDCGRYLNILSTILIKSD